MTSAISLAAFLFVSSFDLQLAERPTFQSSVLVQVAPPFVSPNGLTYSWTKEGVAWSGPEQEHFDIKPIFGNLLTQDEMKAIQERRSSADADALVETGKLRPHEGQLAASSPSQQEKSTADGPFGEMNQMSDKGSSRTEASTVPTTSAGNVCENEGLRTHFGKTMREDALSIGKWGLCYDRRVNTGDVNIYFPANPEASANSTAPCNSIGKNYHAGTINVNARAVSITHGPLSICTNIEKLRAESLQAYLSHEMFFLNTISARSAPTAVTLSAGLPGEIFALPMASHKDWFIFPGSFAAGTPNIEVTTGVPKAWNQLKFAAGKIGWTKLSVKNSAVSGSQPDMDAMAFLSATGEVVQLHVGPGEVRHIDVEHILAFPDDEAFDVATGLDGQSGLLLSGEGAVLKYTAPAEGGQIVVQLRSLRREAFQIALMGQLDTKCPRNTAALHTEILHTRMEMDLPSSSASTSASRGISSLMERRSDGGLDSSGQVETAMDGSEHSSLLKHNAAGDPAEDIFGDLAGAAPFYKESAPSRAASEHVMETVSPAGDGMESAPEMAAPEQAIEAGTVTRSGVDDKSVPKASSEHVMESGAVDVLASKSAPKDPSLEHHGFSHDLDSQHEGDTSDGNTPLISFKSGMAGIGLKRSEKAIVPSKPLLSLDHIDIGIGPQQSAGWAPSPVGDKPSISFKHKLSGDDSGAGKDNISNQHDDTPLISLNAKLRGEEFTPGEAKIPNVQAAEPLNSFRHQPNEIRADEHVRRQRYPASVGIGIGPEQRAGWAASPHVGEPLLSLKGGLTRDDSATGGAKGPNVHIDTPLLSFDDVGIGIGPEQRAGLVPRPDDGELNGSMAHDGLVPANEEVPTEHGDKPLLSLDDVGIGIGPEQSAGWVPSPDAGEPLFSFTHKVPSISVHHAGSLNVTDASSTERHPAYNPKPGHRWGLADDRLETIVEAKEHTPAERIVEAEEHKPVAQGNQFSFWTQHDGTSLLKECECRSLVPGIDFDDGKGLCLEGNPHDLGPENAVCFRLHRGEVEAVLKERRAQVHSEPGSTVYYTKAPFAGIDVQLSSTNGGMFKPLERYNAYEALVQNSYANNLNDPVGVSFGTILGGEIVPVPMRPGDVYLLRPGAYICGTANIRVSFVRSLHDMLASETGELFLQKVELIPLDSDAGPDAALRPGLFFVEVLGVTKMHRINDHKHLVVDNGLFVMGQLHTGQLRSSGAAPFDIEWLGSAERRSWKDKMFTGEGMMMKFGSMEEHDRIVVTQSVNSASFARKLIANMQGCPCRDLELVAGKALLETAVYTSKHTEKKQGGHDDRVVEERRAKTDVRSLDWHNSDSLSIATLEDQPEKNFSASIYTLSDKTEIEQLGCAVGVAALRVTLPASADVKDASIDGAGGTVVTYNNVRLSPHSTGDANMYSTQMCLISGSDLRWDKFTTNPGSTSQGQLLITEAGAEDLMRIKIGGGEDAWKVKTGHVLATSTDVKLRAEWCGLKQEVGVGFMLIILNSDGKDTDRYAWIWSSGHMRHHVLKEGESLVLDDGHLIAMKKPMRYSIARASGMLGVPQGGDGLLLHFRGPGELITSSKNMRQYSQYLCAAAVGA